MFVDYDGNTVLGLIIGAFIGALSITASIIKGNIQYELWKMNGDIEIESDHVEIKKSWLIKDPIASIIFTLRLVKSNEYREVFNENNLSKRNWFDMWLEWEVHNIFGYFSALFGALVFFPEMLMSNQPISFAMNCIFWRSYDVYLENSKDWWKWWKKINEKK